MKQNRSIMLCTVCLLLLGMFLTACGGKTESADIWENAMYTEDTMLGTGTKHLVVTIQAEERAVTLTLQTDKDNLEEALSQHQLISGEEGPYGLYVKSVNGMRADYDIDQTYWSLCQESVPLQSGVSQTKIADGDRFELVRMK